MKTAFYVESYGRQVEEKGFDSQDQRDLGLQKATRSKTSRI